MRKLILIAACVATLSARAAVTKPSMTPQNKTKDHCECVQEIYKVANGNPGMLSNGLYRDYLSWRRNATMRPERRHQG
jgi:hypothetical protein